MVCLSVCMVLVWGFGLLFGGFGLWPVVVVVVLCVLLLFQMCVFVCCILYWDVDVDFKLMTLGLGMMMMIRVGVWFILTFGHRFGCCCPWVRIWI